jgi:predicted transcriptional regulator of viral defense system
MNKLEEKIRNIPKSYFSFIDAMKIADIDEASLKVALVRMAKRKSIARIVRGYYAIDVSRVNWEAFAAEICGECYFSFEWALAGYGVLSQQPAAFTLATAGRSRKIKTSQNIIICRHLKQELFWGYRREGGILIAEKEKAFLDQAYLSLNGAAVFDPGEMNLDLLDKKILKKYLARFKNRRLEKLLARHL